ncbi:MAG: hypothetical protein IJN84_04030 [Clostridia bacterium]|nr:hypothetical protein [Clostridia bacterium]
MKLSAKSIVLSAALLSAAFSAVITLNASKNREKPAVLPVNTTEANISVTTVSVPEHQYVAKIWGDSLVIFATSDMKEPYYISNISLHSLTNEDYKILKDGIYLDTHEDISRLLEDFES